METTKSITLAALLTASVAGSVYLSTNGTTLEKVTLPLAPITDVRLLTAPQDCQDEIQKVGQDCALTTAWYPHGGKMVYPDKVYTEEGVETPPSLAEMRELNFVEREVWTCGGAVMPDRIQNCLDALEPIVGVVVTK
ncbi:MAG TPA: hypothetical protein ENH33_00680 [Actinobacteria bacterium]|nr:hypothetical protein [Actinomycetota bacterium]